MKQRLLILALTLLGVSAYPYLVHAEDTADTKQELGITLEVNADVVSSYLWRGQNLGGISIQPSVTFGWKGLYVCGWANIGTDNWAFENLNPELDITIGYDNYGFQADLTHLHYFDGPYFPKGGFQVVPEQESSSTMEAHIGFHLGDLIESVPLSIDWYTTVFGADYYLKDGTDKRAWSTYIEAGYDFSLPFDLVLAARVGIVPWRSFYTNYEEVWTNAKTVAINNINLRLEREFELKSLYVGVWGECMLNCYGLDKNNLTTSLENKFDQRLNWCIGGYVCIFNDW
jgi:hypothetical protein